MLSTLSNPQTHSRMVTHANIRKQHLAASGDQPTITKLAYAKMFGLSYQQAEADFHWLLEDGILVSYRKAYNSYSINPTRVKGNQFIMGGLTFTLNANLVH